MQVPSSIANSSDRQRRTDCYADALAVIDDLNSITSVDGLVATLAKAFSTYGIDHFVIAGLPNPEERFEKVVVLKHWSAEWFDVYTKEQFVKDDPVVRLCRRVPCLLNGTRRPLIGSESHALSS